MTFPLTVDMLRAAYNYLCTTPPFDGWNLPDGEDVTFKVNRSRRFCGTHYLVGDTHVIEISDRFHGKSDSLLMTMGHEMIHLHQEMTGMSSSRVHHNEAFACLAERICEIHGWDQKLF